MMIILGYNGWRERRFSFKPHVEFWLYKNGKAAARFRVKEYKSNEGYP